MCTTPDLFEVPEEQFVAIIPSKCFDDQCRVEFVRIDNKEFERSDDLRERF